MKIRPMNKDDVESLLPAFLDMERHYAGRAALDEPTARARLTEALGLPAGILLAAYAEEDVQGFLSIYELFPGPQLRPVWFMKELYVCEHARGRGVGEALVRQAARVVIDRGGSRLDFTAGRDNGGARKFYERLGAQEVPAVFLRLDDADLSRLAELEG